MRVRVRFTARWYNVEYKLWWLPFWIDTGPAFSTKEDAIEAARKMLDVTEVTRDGGAK